MCLCHVFMSLHFPVSVSKLRRRLWVRLRTAEEKEIYWFRNPTQETNSLRNPTQAKDSAILMSSKEIEEMQMATVRVIPGCLE